MAVLMLFIFFEVVFAVFFCEVSFVAQHISPEVLEKGHPVTISVSLLLQLHSKQFGNFVI